MGLYVSAKMNFENRDALKNAARDILYRSGAEKEKASKLAEKTIFGDEFNSQASILRASTQISINSSLEETLRYLKAQGHRKPRKTPKLGELWDICNKEDDNYSGELIDLEIDLTNNIFAA